ncbi:DUF3237 domain-containing protein [Jidongwangia harbinensis]|uniref:DUF3237 domain-containing protein n=1 Tax=Jidongwangia harbinensis TaxID=2878561 RepID=UPI001CD9CC8B|nr:DUF3237 family protein [Jidongwangia harbinensis]MCA2216019.1 DUF3237 domain-containing protein [Jidongwangia harbinensis]
MTKSRHPLTMVLIAGLTGVLAAVSGAPVPGRAAAASGETTVPDASWSCGMPAGIPWPERGTPVLTATLRLGAVHDVGVTPSGYRRVLDVSGGTLAGDRVTGTVLSGGLEYELTLATGTTEIEQLHMVRFADNSIGYLRTCGVTAGDVTVVVPDFEVANSSANAWLNTGRFAGVRTVDAASGTVRLAVYDISGVPADGPTVTVTDPAGVPHQSWDCVTGTGARGATVFSEAVTLGGSLSVGASKRGTRNVIPITGGTVSGRVAGTIVPGGADYQLIGSTARLDARYLLRTNDGEYIVVRNCGAFGQLIPVFEARAAGPYHFLNTGRFLSSDPQLQGGGVLIVFYERR